IVLRDRHLQNMVWPDVAVAVVPNPEFLREGAAIHDFKHPDRILVGTNDERAKAVWKRSASSQPGANYLHCAPNSRAHQVRSQCIPRYQDYHSPIYVNELARTCRKLPVVSARIASIFLHAGPGFGGSCFPTDLRALIKTAHDYDVPLRILEAAKTVNDTRKRAMARNYGLAYTSVGCLPTQQPINPATAVCLRYCGQCMTEIARQGHKS